VNHIFRLVWNRKLGVLQVASEFARGRTKSGRNADGGKRRVAWLASVPLSLPLLAFAAIPSQSTITTSAALTSVSAVAANALPNGGKVTSGTGRLAQRGDTLTITQQSQNLSLNWQSFNIGSQSTVNFVQPDASAIAVNRIADTNGSRIFGRLNANGQVFLINPNGILFGQGAQVNVGGLVASTLDVNDSSLGSSSLSFSGTGKGSVTNLGTINVTGGGYAALLGNQVRNQGAIHAQLGSVALAGGSAVTLNFGGDKLVSVRVDQSTLNALAQNGQLIEANGGNVWMTAGARESLLASAVNNTGTIEAQTVQNQHGHIMLLGGMDAGTVDVGGTLDASAPSGAGGGEIETSAANVNVANNARITTAAAMGLAGTWLIDPHDFTVAPSGGNITGATLASELAGGSVTIQSSSGTTGGSGNINVNDNVGWSAHTLTLTAADNVKINATMTASGTAGLVVNTATANGSDAAVAGGTLIMGLGGSGFAGQVNFTGSNTLSINGSSFTLIGSATALQSVGTSGNYALASNLTLSGNFTPIGNSTTPFSGVFDGLGHTISGLTITNSSATGVGLFGVSSGTIRNVGLPGGSVSGTGIGASIGELVGDNKGAISNVFTTGTVSGVGTATSGGEWVGGLVGENEASGTISNAFAKGAVSGSSYSASLGGLVGTNYGSIRNAYATGSVSGSYGGATSAGDNIGGLVGYNPGVIQNAYATGNVSWGGGGTSNNNFIGGLIGSDSGSITDAYATGHVSGGDSSDQLGGLVGYASGGTITASYWDTTASGQSSGTSSTSTVTTGMTGLNDAQMMQAGNFSWTIATSGGSSDTWRIYAGHTTPLLESLLIPLTINANNQAVTYNGTNQAGAVLSYSLPSPDLSAITLGLTSAQHAGTYSESVASAYSSNYDLSFGTTSATLTINPATLTPTLTNSGVTKAYDGTTAAPSGFTPTYSYSGLMSGDSANLTDTGIAYNSAHVTSATDVIVSGLSISSITGSNGSLVSDYSLASTSAGVAATITPKVLTATAPTIGGVTTKVYDGTTTANGASLSGGSVSGWISGDSLSLNESGLTLTYNSSHVATASNISASGSLTVNILSSTNGSQSTDYSVSPPSIASVAATITPATLTATLTNSGVSKVYDGTTNAPIGFTPTYSYVGFVSGDTGASLTSANAAYNSAHVANATDVTVSGLSISGIAGSNGSQTSDYSLSSTSANVAATITPAPLTVSLSNTTGVTKTYDGTTAAPSGFSPTYSLTGLVSGDSAIVSSSSAPVFDSSHAGVATAITQGGLSLSSVVGNGSDNSVLSDYTLSSTTASTGAGIASITPATLGVTLTNSGVTKIYDGTTAAPAGFTPTYSYSGLIAGDTSAGITDTSVAYNSAHVASAIDITVSGLGISSITGSNGSLTSDYSLAFIGVSVGATITPAPLTVSLSNITNVTKTYDGTTAAPSGFSPTYNITGLVSGDTATVSSAATPVFNSAHVTSATAITQDGLSLATITGNGTDNSELTDYSLSNTTASTGAGVASISPLVLTATAPTIGGVTTKVYDGSTGASGATLIGGGVSGALSGDNLTLNTSGIALAYNSSHVVGASSISASGSLAVDILSSTNGSQSTDYSVLLPTITSVAGTITQAPLTAILTNTGVTKTYDGTANAPVGFTPIYSYSGLVPGDSGATLTDTGAAYNSAHVASATGITVSGLNISSITGSDGSLATDYFLVSSSANVAATITPAMLTATLTNSGLTKVYDGTTNAPVGFAPTYGYSGFVSGDTAATLTNAGAAYNSSQVRNATGVTVSGLGISSVTGSNGSLASDYSLASTSASAAATITPATLTASLTGTISKVYDGTTTATLTSNNYMLSGFVSGQGATVTQTNGIYNSSNVASATSVAAALGGSDFAANSGTNLSNYTLPISASGAASITPALLVVTANNANKTYDAIAYSGGNGVTYSGFVHGESASVLGGTLAYGGSSQGAVNAGFYAITPTGLSSSNYTINYDNGLLTVSPATLTASLIGTVSKVYDGTTAATLTSGNYTLTGVIGGDVVNLNDPTSGVYATANVGSGINVQASGLAISGSGAGNYILSNSTATAAIGVITPAPLTVTANNASAIYNAHAYSGGNGVIYSGFVDGQTAAVLDGALTYGGSSQGALNVGSYVLTPGGLASNNYAISYASGTLTLTPATLTYVATPAQVYAGQAIPALTGTVTGFQGSDTLGSATTGTLAFTTPATAQSPAGQYAISGNGLVANEGNYVFVQAAGNALAFNVIADGGETSPIAYLQQQLGQPAPAATVLSPGGLLASTVATSEESSPATLPLRSATPVAASDLYTPDVRVVGGGVRLP
jgi:filamentous hemagglutinin family protein